MKRPTRDDPSRKQGTIVAGDGAHADEGNTRKQDAAVDPPMPDQPAPRRTTAETPVITKPEPARPRAKRRAV